MVAAVEQEENGPQAVRAAVPPKCPSGERALSPKLSFLGLWTTKEPKAALDCCGAKNE